MLYDLGKKPKIPLRPNSEMKGHVLLEDLLKCEHREAILHLKHCQEFISLRYGNRSPQ